MAENFSIYPGGRELPGWQFFDIHDGELQQKLSESEKVYLPIIAILNTEHSYIVTCDIDCGTFPVYRDGDYMKEKKSLGRALHYAEKLAVKLK